MKTEAAQAEVIPLMPAMETISRKIRLERLVVLERAVSDIDRRQAVLAARAQLESDRHRIVKQA